MRNKHIEIVRAACVAANPEIRKYKGGFRGFPVVEERPIRLADVLLAMCARLGALTHTNDRGISVGNYNVAKLLEGKLAWSLTKDDLTEQSDECLAFLATLLSETTV